VQNIAVMTRNVHVHAIKNPSIDQINIYQM